MTLIFTFWYLNQMKHMHLIQSFQKERWYHTTSHVILDGRTIWQHQKLRGDGSIDVSSLKMSGNSKNYSLRRREYHTFNFKYQRRVKNVGMAKEVGWRNCRHRRWRSRLRNIMLSNFNQNTKWKDKLGRRFSYKLYK